MLRTLFFFSFFGSLIAVSQNRSECNREIANYYLEKSIDSLPSVSVGSVGQGELKHGKLMPYKGVNFMYFDQESYLEGRAFLNGEVRSVLLEAYDSLHKLLPNRYFGVMECSNEEGGELFPYKTHQNGLSVDFMTPLIKNDKPYYGLDTLGAKHYIEF